MSKEHKEWLWDIAKKVLGAVIAIGIASYVSYHWHQPVADAKLRGRVTNLEERSKQITRQLSQIQSTLDKIQSNQAVQAEQINRLRKDLEAKQ